MGKNACWHYNEGLIQIPAPAQKLGMVIYALVTLAPRGKEKGLLGLADHQPSSRFSQTLSQRTKAERGRARQQTRYTRRPDISTYP